MGVVRKVLLCCALLFSFFSLKSQHDDEVIIVLKENNKLLVRFQLPAFEIRDTNFVQQYGITDIFNYIKIDDEFGVVDSMGLPLLPQFTFDLHVPYHATDFEITLISADTRKIEVEKKIMPAQEEKIICSSNETSENHVVNFSMNHDYYNTSNIDNDFILLNETFVVFGERGINLTVFPFQYQPQQDNLTVVQNALFSISYTLPEQKHDSFQSEAKESYLNSLFKNYDMDESAPPPRGRYLMITPPAFESVLDTFAKYKQHIGFEVRVVNTNTTGKNRASIKNYIQELYNNLSSRPTYVLLVGDVDQIPAFQGNATGKVMFDPITDLGYALLDGNDNFADVFLGRFSVENEQQLQNIINKTIYMETNMRSFPKKAVFITGDEKKKLWNRAYMLNSFKKVHQNIIKNLTPMGYDCQVLMQPTKIEVIKALGDNPLLFIYTGHGATASFAGRSFELDYKDIAIANNSVFPIVFAFSCKTGNYAQTCIGEHFIRAKEKGAVAYFGSSVNTQAYSDPVVAKKIFDEFPIKENRSLSVIINLGMRQYANASGISKKKKEVYLKSYNLLGDPSLNVRALK